MLIFAGPNPFAIMLFALALDLAFGDMKLLFRFLPHPMVLAGRAIVWFDKRLNRIARSDQSWRARGIATVLVMAAVAAALGWIIKQYLGVVHFGWLAEAFLVAILISQRGLFERTSAIARAQQKGGLADGRAAAVTRTDVDPESLDEHGVLRVAIESLFEDLSDGVVAPLFWYALFGLPGIFVSTTAAMLDTMLGHRSARYLHFGWAAARFDDLLNWIPARVTALLIAVAALVLPETKFFAAFRTMIADAGKHRSFNNGWPDAAAAGALGIALGGPRRHGGMTANAAWIGQGRARVTFTDFAAALKLYLTTVIILALLLLIAAACWWQWS
jgi:adenosylcobinamide-phosphate synthase